MILSDYLVSPTLDYRFIALNTPDILRVLHTNYIVCVYCMQQNTQNKENYAKICEFWSQKTNLEEKVSS